MMKADHRSKGIGSGIVREVCTKLSDCGFRRIRLAYAGSNPQSRAFWIKNEFIPVSTVKREPYDLVIAERTLPAAFEEREKL